MMAIGDRTEIVNLVEKELADYTYTFPRALKVSIHLTLNSG